MNPGGSIKDRIAQSMIADAMSKGLVHRDTEFVEPTSGNTGIGIAFACTQNGHKSVIVTTEKNSDEKVNTLRLQQALRDPGADAASPPCRKRRLAGP
ncbi:cystathionine beta-synthase-like [Choristoneura fumiferana]|uniref:cystathionine beta-synthase-like n=1 Tax=Choristoneura fumiferana TaxID=7141 RepID=UPI003D157BEE